MSDPPQDPGRLPHAAAGSPASSLRAALAFSDLTLSELWLAQAGLCGTLSAPEVAAALAGTLPLSELQYDVLAQAFNDHFLDRGDATVARYAYELDTAARGALVRQTRVQAARAMRLRAERARVRADLMRTDDRARRLRIRR